MMLQKLEFTVFSWRESTMYRYHDKKDDKLYTFDVLAYAVKGILEVNFNHGQLNMAEQIVLPNLIDSFSIDGQKIFKIVPTK